MDNLALLFGGNLNLVSPGLSNGTNPGTVQHTAILTYLINGEFRTKAATNNIAPAQVDGSGVVVASGFTQRANTSALYAIWIDRAGTGYSVTKGADVAIADLAAGVTLLPTPPLLAQRALLGYVRVANAQAGNLPFVFGTTLFGAAGVTTTYVQTATPSPLPIA